MLETVLVASVLIGGFALQFGRPPALWMNRSETRWLLMLQLLLLIIAYLLPNKWVGITVAYIAIHPWLTHIAYSYHLLPYAPTRDSTYEPLFPVLWWSVMYLALSRLYYPGAWVIMAWVLVVWATVNALVSLYNDSRPLPRLWVDSRSPKFPKSCGLTGSTWLLSYTTAIGALCCGLLATHYQGPIAWGNINLYVSLLLTLSLSLLLFSWSTGTRAPSIALLLTFLIYESIHTSPLVLLWVLPVSFLSVRIGSTYVGRYLLWPWEDTTGNIRLHSWHNALQMVISTYFIGIGLGMWGALTDPRPVDNEWRNLHNDWLQSVVELGPIPVICALLLLINIWHQPLTHDSLFSTTLITMTAIYAVWYFPMRDHFTAVLLAFALAVRG